MMVRRHPLLFAAWLSLAMAASWTTAARGLGPGDPAPDFTLQDVNGTSYTLSDYRGQVVLLALIGHG